MLGRNLSDWVDQTRIISFNVCRTADEMASRVKWVMMAAIQRYRLPISFMAADIHVFDGYVGPGYAKADEKLYDFVAELAREDGLVLDPVYTGKAMLGLITELKNKTERSKLFGNKILFVHTGGLFSLFAHREALARAIVRSGQ